MTIQEIFQRIEDGAYEHKVQYPKGRPYKDGRIFDENQSVKWNCEQVRLKNEERAAAITAYRTEESALASQFEEDATEALMDEFGLNAAQARRAFAMGYEDGHSGGFFEVLNTAQKYGDFAADILKFAGAGSNALNGLKMRIPTTQEWNRMMDAVNDRDKTAHWRHMFTWVHDCHSENVATRTVRGYYNACNLDYYSDTLRREFIGFRPAFDALPADMQPAKVQDGTLITAGTLYMDGKPVRVPQKPVEDGDIEEYISGAKLTFGPAVEDAAYVVKAIAVGGVFIADRVMLHSISYKDIETALC